MNLVEQAKKYIYGMGIEAAMSKWDKKKATVQNWINTETIPVYVIQSMLDEQGGLFADLVEDAPVAAQPQPAPFPSPSSDEIEALWGNIATLREEIGSIMNAIGNIESFLGQVKLPQQQVSRPVPPPRVISADPSSTSGVEGTVFQPMTRLGGGKAFELPPPTPKRFGKTMKSLMEPMRPLKRDR